VPDGAEGKGTKGEVGDGACSSTRRGTGFARPQAWSPWGAEGRGSKPACAGLDSPRKYRL